MASKSTVHVRIAGASYKFTSDSDPERLHLIANMVNERIDALGPKAPQSAAAAQLLAVVALELADELQTMRENSTKVTEQARTVVKNAIKRIDERLDADTQLASAGPSPRP